MESPESNNLDQKNLKALIQQRGSNLEIRRVLKQRVRGAWFLVRMQPMQPSRGKQT